jgi:hypothetical protein
MMTYVEEKIKEHKDEGKGEPSGLFEVPLAAPVVQPSDTKDKNSGTIRISLSAAPEALKKVLFIVATAGGGGGIVHMIHQWLLN